MTATLEATPRGETHWSTRPMAKHMPEAEAIHAIRTVQATLDAMTASLQWEPILRLARGDA